MKPIKPIYVIILVIVFAAAGFYGGVIYQKNQRSSFSFAGGGAGGQYAGRRFGGAGGAAGQGGAGGGAAMMPVRGQIVAAGNNSITVKMQDGSSKIVNLTGQTQVNKTTSGSASDLKTGTTVTAIGAANSDGSVTAQNVMIGNGAMMMRGGGGPKNSTGASGQ
jgi:hypothetical protein